MDVPTTHSYTLVSDPLPDPAAATPGGQPEWERTNTPGLYRRRNGQYYSRFAVSGRRTFRCLRTDTLSVAKIRHAQRTGHVERARQAGIALGAGLSSLGQLARALEQEVATSNLSPRARAAYSVRIQRLRDAWAGNFETAQARLVTRDTIARLREQLLHESRHFRHPERVGYKPAVANQALAVLRMMLQIAVQNQVIMVSPFDTPGAIRQSLYAPANTRRPEIPENATLERIFAEMERVPNAENLDSTVLRRFSAGATNAAEHARFLAYSGLRVSEAAAARWEDVRGDWLHVRGTKTAASARIVPILPPLRALLDQIRCKRFAGPILGCRRSIAAIRRACDRLGLPRLRHHDLRHFFATACIEEGVDIPTVSDWLGHCDGGALLLKTYRHLRSRHSLEAAKKITFGSPLVRVMSA